MVIQILGADLYQAGRAVRGKVLHQRRAGFFEGGVQRRQHTVHTEQCRPEVAGQRADNITHFGSKHGVPCGTQLLLAQIAKIHIRQGKPTVRDQPLKCIAIHLERSGGLIGGLLIAEDQTFDQAAFGLDVFIRAVVIGGLQLFVGQLYFVQQILRAHRDIADGLAGGQNELIGVLVVIGLQLRIGGVGQGRIQIILRQFGPSKAALLAHIGDKRVGIGTGHRNTAGDRFLQQGAARFLAQRLFEFILVQTGLL